MLKTGLSAFVLFVFVLACPVQDNASVDLKSLYETHQWSKLRDRLRAQDPGLYRGAVAAAFNRVSDAETILGAVNQQGSDSEEDDASKWLAYMYLRAGGYQNAGAELAEDSSLGAMLRSLPNQSITHFGQSATSSRVIERRLFVPASLDGAAVEFFLDSDANFSFLSESEARNLGLAIQESGLAVQGVTGLESYFRVAVAQSLRVGEIELHDVTFLILPDSERVFRGLQISQQGALGISVLLSFRSFRFDNKGIFEIGCGAGKKSGEENFYFDGADPVLNVEFDGQQLPFVLDTGAEITEIWPPFARGFPSLAQAARATLGTENGIGGKLRIAERILPRIDFLIGGYYAQLRPARMLLSETTPQTRWYYGRLGFDTLRQARQVTIDFDSLTIRIE